MQKAYFVIGVAFAARGCEINEVDWKDVSRLDAIGSAATGDGSTGDTIGTYRIRYYRSKAREAVSTEPEYCFIHDSLQVQVLDNYFAFLASRIQTRYFFFVLCARSFEYYACVSQAIYFAN